MQGQVDFTVLNTKTTQDVGRREKEEFVQEELNILTIATIAKAICDYVDPSKSST